MSKTIFATLAYYDAFHMPLTAFEVWRYRIAPAEENDRKETTLRDVTSELETLVSQNLIGEKWGFYFLLPKGRDMSSGARMVEQRLRRLKIADEKWKRAKKSVWV